MRTIAEFIVKRPDDEMQQIAHIRREWIELREELYEILTELRAIPTEKVIQDYQPYYIRRIGLLEYLVDKMATIERLFDKGLNLHLHPDDRIEIRSSEALDHQSVTVTPDYDDAEATEIVEDITAEIDELTMVISTVGREANRGEKVMQEVNRDLNRNPENFDIHQ